MPPVGTNFTPPNGPASALIAGAPPEVCAGKNFTACRPAASAAWISVAVIVLGSGSTHRAVQRRTTATVNPGEAEAAEREYTDVSTCSTCRTIPAHMNIDTPTDSA